MRVRLRFTKHGKVRFTSHRDLARVWERALRRAGLPVASTEGFSPRPKVHFGLALSTGHESQGEYLDVDLLDPEVGASPIDVAGLPDLLTPLLPPGVDVTAAAVVDRRDDSLQQAVTACTWQIEVLGPTPEEVTAAVDRLLAADEVVVTRVRKGQEVVDDIRPAVRNLEMIGPVSEDRHRTGGVVVAEVATQPRGVRPGELIAALAPDAEEGRVCRLHQWIETDGARQDPLPEATRLPHAEVRAS